MGIIDAEIARQAGVTTSSIARGDQGRRMAAPPEGEAAQRLYTGAELPAITSASAAPTASETTAGSIVAAGAPFLRFVHLDGLAVKVRSIHFGYCRFALFLLGKSYESKSPGTPRIAVGDDLGFGDFPM